MTTSTKANNKPSSKAGNTNKTPDNNLAKNTNAKTAGANKEGTETSTDTAEATPAAEEGSNAEGTDTPATEEQKAQAKRVTLMSALESGDALAVAEVLIKQGRTQEQIASFAETFGQATKSFAEVVAKQEAEAKQRAAEKEKADRELEEERQKAQEIVEAGKKAAIEEMIKKLESTGIKPEMAVQIANSTFGGGARSGGAAPKATVRVKYKDDLYTVKVTGNDKEAIKKMIAESGLSRADFIKQYQISE
ncbi:hypothetical protein XaC1_16 [Xanthomonas phage XaC1]|nr:hypothetical protein XaC1_16 [Xanthomonas phage XaC1]